MELKFAFTLYAVLITSLLAGQELTIEWQNTIGGTDFDHVHTVLQTTDGGYIVGGGSNSPLSGDKDEANFGLEDFWILKLDVEGEILWQNSIGGSASDSFEDLIETADGGFLIGGSSSSPISVDKSEAQIGGSDYWILKLDALGVIQWQNTIGGSGNESLAGLLEVGDGYILGGYSDSGISGDKSEALIGGYDYWVVKVDLAGNVLWDRTIGGTDNDLLRDLTYSSTDDGFCLVGASVSGISGNKSEAAYDPVGDYWVVRIASDGSFVLDKTIGAAEGDDPRAIQATSDGGYLIAGVSYSNISGDKTEDSKGGTDFWVVKINQVGLVEWDKTLGGLSTDVPVSVNITAEDDYVIGGHSASDISGDKTEDSRGAFDYWLIKIDDSGAVIWDKTFGGDQDDLMFDSNLAIDGGYILGGFSTSNISGDKTEDKINPSTTFFDYWVIKTLECDDIDISVNLVGFTLTAANGYSYQWVDCDDGNNPIAGETAQSFTPTEPGSYAVILSLAGCSDTISDCYDVGTGDLLANSFDQVVLYPNPVVSILKIQANDLQSIKLLDVMGAVIQETRTNGLDMSKLSKGTYFVSITLNDGRLLVEKVIKL